MKPSISALRKPDITYSVVGKLWIEYEGARCFGPGRMQLLQAIGKAGSINKAAKEMGMSYKKAQNMIHELNNQFAEIIVTTEKGGEGGGGSVLTPAAHELMKFHEEMRLRFQQFMAKENALLND